MSSASMSTKLARDHTVFNLFFGHFRLRYGLRVAILSLRFNIILDVLNFCRRQQKT
jgi:hypothetical protein